MAGSGSVELRLRSGINTDDIIFLIFVKGQRQNVKNSARRQNLIFSEGTFIFLLQ
jgi:hypothetical protein